MKRQFEILDGVCIDIDPTQQGLLVVPEVVPLSDEEVGGLGDVSASCFLERFGFSAAPLVLGLILGPIAESNFVTGSLISTAQNGPFVYFFTGGLNILLVSIVILSVGFSIWSEFNSKRQSQ